MKARASFIVEKATVGRVEIIDVGPWDQHPTVTNDAEAVVEELHERGLLHRATTLVYTDSEGEIAQILHDGAGRFTGFAPFEDSQP